MSDEKRRERRQVRAEHGTPARIGEVLARTRNLVADAERYVEAAGIDSRSFGLPFDIEDVNMGRYQSLSNAKGWRKLRL